MNDKLTTKQISELTEVSIPTLRYYERIGLLDRVDRADNGHRLYSEADVRRVDFLKHLRGTQMSITEMQHYVGLFRTGEKTIMERRQILESHRREVQKQIDALCETLVLLDRKIDHYGWLEEQVEQGQFTYPINERGLIPIEDIECPIGADYGTANGTGNGQ
ncbi:MAG: MerR family transcriptional regulator [Chloroflexi bacterium]|nr:MerR family transcriptional regulator [Chloroflexota bacterium]